jgi:hypothetical protein
MFKLAAILLATLFVANCHGFLGINPGNIGNIGGLGNLGGYTERPELLGDQKMQALVSYAAESLSIAQNLILNNLKVIRVQTQLVNGVNYKLDFTAEPINGISGQTTTCQVVINVGLDFVNQILQSQCQTTS